MTDEEIQHDEYLVRVQAQVMIRDDSSGGFLPMGGGGLSCVGVKRLPTGENSPHEYVIYGERLVDSSVVLDCKLKRDIQYIKANPKFHHWRTDDKRFGLTFERSDDAKSFSKGIEEAVTDLFQGSNECNISRQEEKIFEELDLPLGRKDSSSQSASTASTTTSSPTAQSPTSVVPGALESYHLPHTNHLHRIHYINTYTNGQKVTSSPPSDKSSSKSDSFDSSSFGREDIFIRDDDPASLSGKSDQALLKDVSEMGKQYYVFFRHNKPQQHDYSYPAMDSMNSEPIKPDLQSGKKKNSSSVITSQPPLPTKKNKKSGLLLSQRKYQCKYCHEHFTPEDNKRGRCEEAPDRVKKCIEAVSCLCCAEGLIFHCFSDADGEYRQPCTCDTNNETNCIKWTALTILSIFVPCLWCYLPMNACHRCGVACGCCGGRHKAT